METVTINEVEFELIKDHREAFDLEAVQEKLTEYFLEFDYVIGDWSYEKLRLKGFLEKDNKKVKPINNIEGKDLYLKESCAYDCKYFVLKKK